jgi:ankyrin repeat protein
MCAYGGHEEIARLLLDHGADLDNIDVDGDTPTSLAAQRRHTKLVILFDEVREARDRELREMDGKVPEK